MTEIKHWVRIKAGSQKPSEESVSERWSDQLCQIQLLGKVK